MKRVLASLVIVSSLLLPAISIGGHASAVHIFDNSNCAAGETVCDNACNTSAQANNSTVCQSVKNQENKGADNPIIDVIRVAINVIAYIIGVAAVVGLVVNAIRLIISSGESNAAASARTGVITSLVGLAVAALALVIVNLVIGN